MRNQKQKKRKVAKFTFFLKKNHNFSCTMSKKYTFVLMQMTIYLLFNVLIALILLPQNTNLMSREKYYTNVTVKSNTKL